MQHVQSAAHDSVPSYVRHERQPLATGTYHPLAKSNETLSPSTSGHAVARHYIRTRLRFAQHHPVRAFSRRPLQLRHRIFLRMFLQLHTQGNITPPIPCHPATSPCRKHIPQNARHSIGAHRAWFCTGRTGHRQSGQNHHTYHPHRRHQSTRRLAYVHQLQSRQLIVKFFRAHTPCGKSV